MLIEGGLVTNYEGMNKLLYFLDVKNLPKTHYSNTSGHWKMVSYMHELVVNKTKFLIKGLQFISFSCDGIKIDD
jgi:hypothetical protein